MYYLSCLKQPKAAKPKLTKAEEREGFTEGCRRLQRLIIINNKD